MSITQKNSSSLFCKPVLSEEYLHQECFSLIHGTISFKSFNLLQHLSVMHEWVNMQYTTEFWQMSGSIGLFRSCYQCILQNPDAHSFVGFYNDQMICQFDVYRIAADEIAGHIEHSENDCGFHLLMAPNKQPVHGLTNCVIAAFLNYYFFFPEAERMFAEPDINNIKSIRLLEDAGFKKLKTINMSYKTAHLYCIMREDFLSQKNF